MLAIRHALAAGGKHTRRPLLRMPPLHGTRNLAERKRHCVAGWLDGQRGERMAPSALPRKAWKTNKPIKNVPFNPSTEGKPDMFVGIAKSRALSAADRAVRVAVAVSTSCS